MSNFCCLIICRITCILTGLSFDTLPGSACAGDEPGVRVLNRPSGKDRFVDLKHSDAEFGTRALAWDPTSTLLAVGALDGSLSVWHVSEDLDELTCERVHYDGLVMPHDRSLAGQVCWVPLPAVLIVVVFT